MSIFEYDFMQRAFIVGTILAIILPCIGFPIILRHLSMMGDTLSHSSLAGVSIGLCFGFNPLLGSFIACVVAGLLIEGIREKLKAYHEISTVIIMALSIGLAGIFTSFTGNSNSISSYLFGSIVTISTSELYVVIIISIIVIITYWILYDRLYLLSFDDKNAKLLGINKKFINFIFTFLSAVAVSISAKTIGSLIVSSILVIPVITAMQYMKTYRATLILSIIFSIFFVYIGLFLSYQYNLRPGSVVVLISVAGLLFSMIFKRNRLI